MAVREAGKWISSKCTYVKLKMSGFITKEDGKKGHWGQLAASAN